jgi:hypothetical protein
MHPRPNFRAQKSPRGAGVMAERPKELGMNDQDIEQEIQAKGLTAPRITPADIEANIAHTEIVKHISPSGQVLRWAVLTAKNGFAVAGRPSAAASSENDDAEIGERIAIDNAKSELWALLGFQLRTDLHGRAYCADYPGALPSITAG